MKITSATLSIPVTYVESMSQRLIRWACCAYRVSDISNGFMRGESTITGFGHEVSVQVVWRGADTGVVNIEPLPEPLNCDVSWTDYAGDFPMCHRESTQGGWGI